MPSQITLGIKDMVARAKAEIEEWPADKLYRNFKSDELVIVDIRDVRERARDGYIPGSLHVPRGMLEFWIDPESPYHKPVFAEDKRFLFYCASGWRSALATQTAQNMGLAPVCHLEGGFGGWQKARLPVEQNQQSE